MKKILCIISIIILCNNINAQILNINPLDVGFGYSYQYNTNNKYNIPNNLLVKNLFVIDGTFLGMYCGVEYGSNTIPSNHKYYTNNDASTLICKFGPSLAIDLNYYNFITITPYCGFINNTYDINGDYSDKGMKFLYGIKCGYIYKYFYIGGHLSNKTVGITVGLNFDKLL